MSFAVFITSEAKLVCLTMKSELPFLFRGSSSNSDDLLGSSKELVFPDFHALIASIILSSIVGFSHHFSQYRLAGVSDQADRRCLSFRLIDSLPGRYKIIIY